MIQRILRLGPAAALFWAAVLIAAIAICDWKVVFNATLGFLYMFPLILLGAVLGRWWQILIAAVLCTALSHWLDPFSMDLQVPRDILIFLTLATTGLLSHGVSRSYRRVEKEVIARRSAEEQLEFLIESSPAAVLTMTADGEILLANPAAHRMFGVPAGFAARTQNHALHSGARIGAVHRRVGQDFPHRDADARPAGKRRRVSGGRVLFHL